MKIFFCNGEYPFCYYYRGYLPGVYTGQSVVNDFIRQGSRLSPQTLIDKALEADVVVFQRPNSENIYNVAKLLKERGKKIVFENDDTYLIGKGIMLERLSTDQEREKAQKLSYWTNRFLHLADGVIASTDFLADEYRQVNPNTIVLKNCIDPMDEFPCKENTTGKFRIGFVASVTTNDDYLHIKDVIKALDERDDVTIVVFGIKYKDGSMLEFMRPDYEFWSSLKNLELHPYVHVTQYMSTLADLALDLAVIPRQDSYFNRAKSNLKFLEMSLLEIPVISQGFADGLSPYQQDPDYQTVVVDNNTWLEKILEIKLNYEQYKEKAKEAKTYVLENYNIETFAPMWITGIKNLLWKN